MIYRPNSVPPNRSKTFERFLLQQKLEHVEEHKIINSNHFGFLKKKTSNDSVPF